MLPGRRGEVRDRDNTSSSLQVSVHERGDTHADGVRCRGLRTLALITWKRLSLFNVDQETCSFLRMCVFKWAAPPGLWKYCHSAYGMSQRSHVIVLRFKTTYRYITDDKNALRRTGWCHQKMWHFLVPWHCVFLDRCMLLFLCCFSIWYSQLCFFKYQVSLRCFSWNCIREKTEQKYRQKTETQETFEKNMETFVKCFSK